MYSAAVGWSILHVSVRYNQSIVLFKSSVSLLVFYLVVLSIIENGVLKTPTIIVLLSISLFNFVNVCFVYLGALMLGAYILIIVIFLVY